MIRFVDIRGNETLSRFAWLHTSDSRFISFDGEMVFDSQEDFLQALSCSPNWIEAKDRFLGLMPDWAKKSDPMKYNPEWDDSVHPDHSQWVSTKDTPIRSLLDKEGNCPLFLARTVVGHESDEDWIFGVYATKFQFRFHKEDSLISESILQDIDYFFKVPDLLTHT